MSRALIIIATAGDRERAINWIRQAPWNTRVEFKKEKRTLPQNDRMWAMLTDVASQKEHVGKRYTPDQWKVIFMHACGREVQFIPSLDGASFIPWGQRSSDLSKEEMSELIDFIAAWGAENGVTFHVGVKVSEITYPPELLPGPDEDDEAEVIVCCGGGQCEQGLPCPKAKIVRSIPHIKGGKVTSHLG